MACYHPVTAFRSSSGPRPNGRWPIVFKPLSGLTDDKNTLQVPCGKCVGCRLEYARQWAIRCINEAKCWENNCFITLTYNDYYYKINCINGSLNKRDFVLFMKKLRRMYGAKIRFFHCGEYGKNYGRAHHHACIFNFNFPDKEIFREEGRVKLWISKSLQKLWPFGFSTIGEVNAESAAYCARYVVKKQTKKLMYYGIQPEYTTMSRRPGIGQPFIEQFAEDIYPKGTYLSEGGIKCKPPRYYDNLYDQVEPEVMKKIREERRKLINVADNTAKRLRAREEFTELKLKKFAERNFENA